MEPVQDATQRPSSAIDGLLKFTRAVADDGDPLVMSNAAAIEKLVKACRRGRDLVVNVGVQTRPPSLEAGSAHDKVDVPVVTARWAAMLEPT